MRHRHRFIRAAESLIETMLAVTVIATATTAAITLIRTSLQGNEVIGEKVVALNLGLEAVEAVRNLRDSNLLSMSSDPDECWDTLDGTDASLCATATHISPGDYALSRNFIWASSSPVFEWSLSPVVSEEEYWVSLYDYQPDVSGSVVPIYAQAGLDGTSGLTLVSGHEQDFKRKLSFEADGSGSDDIWNLTVTMEWTEKDQTKTLSLSRSISNLY